MLAVELQRQRIAAREGSPLSVKFGMTALVLRDSFFVFARPAVFVVDVVEHRFELPAHRRLARLRVVMDDGFAFPPLFERFELKVEEVFVLRILPRDFVSGSDFALRTLFERHFLSPHALPCPVHHGIMETGRGRFLSSMAS